MEILGLDPYQSQTQYLEEFFRDFPERRQSGYLYPLCLFSVCGGRRSPGMAETAHCGRPIAGNCSTSTEIL